MQHIVDRSLGERDDVRKARDETLVVGPDCGHLRLLQHDLGDPDAIRRALLLPGQLMAAAPRMPLDERVGQALVRALHHANSNNSTAPAAPRAAGSATWPPRLAK